ncbi:MAG TPA: hypothetical protein VGE83_05140 [Terracidiphilus sp.]
MAEDDKGWKWWLQYVVVPLLVSSGILAVVVGRFSAHSDPNKPTPSSPNSDQSVNFVLRFSATATDNKAGANIDITFDDQDTINLDYSQNPDDDFVSGWMHTQKPMRIPQRDTHRYHLSGTWSPNALYTYNLTGDGSIQIQEGDRILIDFAAGTYTGPDPQPPTGTTYIMKLVVTQ